MSGRLSALRAHWPLLAALAAVGLARALLFAWPVYPDEAGFFLVASDLIDHGGDGLYGHYWVDRPPTLIWLYTLGASTGEVRAMRVLAAVFLAAFVGLAWFAVRRFEASARWAVAVAAAFAITPETGAETANGEAFALPFVMAGLYCAIRATQVPGRAALPWACGAGLLGFVAVTVKQNFADVFVFAIVLLVGLGLRKQRTWRTVAQQLAAGSAGAAVGAALMAGYALTRPGGLDALWLAGVEFRIDASSVLAEGNRTGIEDRLDALTENAWLAGLIPFVIVLAVMAVRLRFRVSALSYAVGALIGFEILCVWLGGNFWTHYLMGLAPGLVLAAGIWARHLPVALASTYLVASALVALPVHLVDLAGRDPDTSQEIGHYVGAAAEPGDTATVLFGNADMQWSSGLRSPYEHLWSLPVRVLDPDLDQLTAVLASDDAPTWLVEAVDPHAWGLDPAHRIDAVIDEHYREVWSGCGSTVLLLRSEVRTFSGPTPDC